METVRFWNGNKSPVRARYERDVLGAVLAATEEDFGAAQVIEDRTDYPRAEDEGNIFQAGADLLVTVAGNPKFTGISRQMIPSSLVGDLLGKRLLIVRKDALSRFDQMRTGAELKQCLAGIPATWADADLFRANGYPVREEGSLEDIFQRLANGRFDYVSLGVLEIEELFASLGKAAGNLALEPTLMLQYPMPLVFYVHPARDTLAMRITRGMQDIRESGALKALRDRTFKATLENLHLEQRRIIYLENPMLPASPID